MYISVMRYGLRATNPLEWIVLHAKKVPLPILDVIVAPIQTRTLIAAERVGLLTALSDGPACLGALAARLTLDSECLGLVLRVLRAMDYVEQTADEWRLSDLGERYFGKASNESYHAFVEYGAPNWKMVDQPHSMRRKVRLLRAAEARSVSCAERSPYRLRSCGRRTVPVAVKSARDPKSTRRAP